jgi:hypothetical protein
MAFRKAAFARVGGFDAALDVGTPAGGGGDLDMFHPLVARGLALWYEPRALVWHQHRREMEALRRQLYDDGKSFTVCLLKLLRTGSVPRHRVARYASSTLGTLARGPDGSRPARAPPVAASAALGRAAEERSKGLPPM